jgi:diguanylate cyclase (GGDEF)-like protein
MGKLDYYVDIAEKSFVVVSPIKYYGTVQGAVIVAFNFPNIIRSSFSNDNNMYVALLEGGRIVYRCNYNEKHSYTVNLHTVSEAQSIFNQLGLSLELGMDSEVYLAPIEKVIFTLIIFGVVFIAFGVFLARRLALSITNPVLELYRRVTANNARGTLFCSPLDTEDELEELAKAFDKRTLMLQYQAEHDALTSLPNRVLFLDRLRENIKIASSNDSVFTILFIDLDHFKEINDSFGHDFGDEFLLVIANELSSIVGERDSVARMGGDEFALLLNNSGALHNIVPILEKIMQIFKKSFKLQGHDFYVTCSIGVAVYPAHGTTPETLLKNADAAMYKAKDEGRNNYKFYTDDMTQKAY